MAIVKDLNNSPPGRAGNQTGIDPHNMSKEEYAFHNDGTRTDASVSSLGAGNQQILAADGTRGTVTVINNAPLDVAVGIQPLSSMSSAGAVPIRSGNGYTWKGPITRGAFYCYGVANQALTILVG